eukprot:5524607-Amphidinium_carterae.1
MACSACKALVVLAPHRPKYPKTIRDKMQKKKTKVHSRVFPFLIEGQTKKSEEWQFTNLPVEKWPRRVQARDERS